jgi:hypothetical protein
MTAGDAVLVQLFRTIRAARAKEIVIITGG